jgi:hypothetical protein
MPSFGLQPHVPLIELENCMTVVSGRVLVAGTDQGIPNLVAVLYDMSHAPQAEGRVVAGSTDHEHIESVGRRLGSVLTDSSGAFELQIDESSRREEPRPELFLMVLAPETDGDSCGVVLHTSCATRRGAAQREAYLVQIRADTLRQAGVPVAPPVHDGSPGAVVAALRARDDRDLTIAVGARELNAARAERKRTIEAEARPALTAFLDQIATLRVDGAHVVRPGVNLPDAFDAAVRASVRDQVNPSRQRGHLAIPPDEVEKLRQRHGGLSDLPADDVEPHLFGAQPTEGSPQALFRHDPLAAHCRDRTLPADRCAGPDSNPEPETEPTSLEPTIPGAGMDLALGSYTDRVLEELGSVFSPRAPAESKRADLEAVQHEIDRLELRSGPADRPAIFDFHSLQIAFEHVWQEVFDDEVTDDFLTLYERVVEHGGVPPAAGDDVLRKLVFEASVLTRATHAEPPVEVLETFEIAPAEWRVLSVESKEKLISLASEAGKSSFLPFTRRDRVERGQRIIDYARAKLDERDVRLDDLHANLQALQRRFREPYSFTIFAAGPKARSINFGLLVTYRQQWSPLGYQAGPLLKTIPLAPKEVRRYSKKHVTKRTRTRKEVTRALQTRSVDEAETMRDVADIVQRAHQKTAFDMTTEGNFNFLLKDASLSTSFGKDSATESSETKQRFREAVRKAAEEYRHERQIEVTTGETTTFEAEESGEISNPNDEISVTYLFFELQRRYQISEKLHRLMPVVLVAQEVPAPHEITEEWLLAHEWVLRRALLDDMFVPALDHLSTIAGEEYSLREQRKHIKALRRLIESLKDELVVLRGTVEQRYGALEQAIARRSAVIAREDADGFLVDVGQFLFGSGAGSSEEAARIREDAARDAFDRAKREEGELTTRLERQVGALQRAVEAYNAAASDHLNRKNAIAQLRVHVKENILHYMQAIWDHEPPDQRFFRLHDARVPVLSGTRRYSLTEDLQALPLAPSWRRPYAFEVRTDVAVENETRPLVEVADLDQLLGYKGNYMVFPLRESNPITTYMMAPYVDEYAGVRDPDPLGNVTLEELDDYVCCLKKELPSEEFESLVPDIHAAYQQLLTSPRRASEEVVIPSGSLFIEALPGVHAVLEDFKLGHRQVDVRKARAEALQEELESARLAARLAEGDYEDPTIDKRIQVVPGAGAPPVVDIGGDE